jgi:nucleoside-diphosphate-sugar epimerase
MVFGADGLPTIGERLELFTGDVRRFSAIPSRILADVDAVIHLAGLSNDPTAEYNPTANESINTGGTMALARQCKIAGIPRFIFASSCSVYYTMEPDDALRDEGYAVDPKAPYSQSKYEAERGLLAMADNDFCPVILRKGTVFGPSPRSRYDLVVNAFTKDAFQRRSLTVHAGGRMWRPMLHIDDAVDAYIACLGATEATIHGQVFNVLSDNYRVIDIAYAVRRALENIKGIQLGIEIQQVGTVRSYRVSGEKFANTFGLKLNGQIGAATVGMWDQLEGGMIDPDDPIHYNIQWLTLLESMQKRLHAMGGGPLT